MRIRNIQLMLCLLAASMLVTSSCQKEEELLPEALPPSAKLKNDMEEDELCGAARYVHDVTVQATESRVQQFIADNPELTSGTSRTVITIPVVFHVVYSTSDQNISDAQLQSQIDVLNEDFNAANADISSVPGVFQSVIGNASLNFVLAARDPNGNATTGITRTYTAVPSFSSNGSVCFTSLGGRDAWPTSQYLNIWVCNKSGAAGYATYPWSGNSLTDGIIVKYTFVGRVGTFTNNWNFQRGRTITHEVGHWLGLIHIWGDATCGSDLVGDTPQQNAANGSCPSFPDLSACSSNPHGDMFMNYMDYTYDACRTMFSSMQVTRMLGYLNTTRAAILTSMGAVPPSGPTCNVPGGLSASSVTSSGATLNWNSTGATSYNVKYKPVSASSWTTAVTSNTSQPVSALSSSAAYEFQVQSVCISGSSAFSASSSFTTLALPSVCNVPGGLVTSSISSSGATLSWNSTGALSYNVRYKPLSSSVWITTFTTTIPKIISGLSSSTAYQFQVQSVCASGSSAYSASSTFTTSALSSGCVVPAGLSTSAVSANSATLVWNSTGAISYIVRYRKTSSSSWMTVSSSTPYRTISWLSSGTPYEFQVRSVCSSGNSPYSSSFTFTTTY